MASCFEDFSNSKQIKYNEVLNWIEYILDLKKKLKNVYHTSFIESSVLCKMNKYSHGAHITPRR